MNIFVFGSSLTSTYWNGAATYYRGIYKNLHRLGHNITFAEPAIYDRQNHKDVRTSITLMYASMNHPVTFPACSSKPAARTSSSSTVAWEQMMPCWKKGPGLPHSKKPHSLLGCRRPGYPLSRGVRRSRSVPPTHPRIRRDLHLWRRASRHCSL